MGCWWQRSIAEVVGSVAKGGAGGVRARILVGGVLLGGGLACFWWGVNEGVADDA